MKKALKILVWGVGGLVGLLIVLVLALPLWVGPVVTGVANAVVPGITGTEFKLEQFSFNPYSGKLRLAGLKLANPQGYEERVAVSLDALSVDIDMGSLFGKKIHFREIALESPFVSYVFDAAESNNFARIAAHATQGKKKQEKEADAEKESASDGEEMRVQIDRLCVNGTYVKYRMIKLPIPVPTFTDIGKTEEGATFEEVIDTVWNAIKNSFTSAGNLVQGAAGAATNVLKNIASDPSAATAGALKAAKDLGGAVGDGTKKVGGAVSEGAKNLGDGAKKVGGAVGDGAKKVGDVAKDLGGAVGTGAKNLGEGAKKVGGAVGDGAKDALKKIGGLFGK